jgi:nucleoside-diphosphate-sugar epimerase
VRVFVTGGTGVIAAVALPLLRAAGHEVVAPGREELDLFDAAAVRDAVAGFDAVIHAATRVGDRAANDRLRAEGSRNLVDGALAGGAQVYVQPTITFLQLAGVQAAERETARFAASGGRGVVLRFGLLYGPRTGNDGPNPMYDSTLHVDVAGRAVVAALALPSGTYVYED